MGALGSKETAVKWYDDYVATNLPPSCFEGKTIAITGCTSGTGYILAETCIANNAGTVLLLNRSSERSTEAHKKLQEVGVAKNSKTIVESIPCDLQDFANVRAAIETIKSKYEAIDVLCNNAGVMALEDVATVDGYDIQMQTNHISHFLLTKELFPLLKRAAELRGEARVVHHTSMARNSPSKLKSEYVEKKGGDLGGNGGRMLSNGPRWERYGQSKLANAAFTLELSNRLKEGRESTKGIKSVVAAPGLAKTSLQQTTHASGGMGTFDMFLIKIAQSPEDGTMPLLAACFLPGTENGDFYEPSGPMRAYGLPMKVPYNKNCLDPEQRTMLWTKSEEACGEFTMQ